MRRCSVTSSRRVLEVTLVFARLGVTSFGGPIAHLGYLQREFVDRKRWLTASAFADLIALCQFLPGPASSQAVFAIGLQRAGMAGAIAATLAFLAPSAALMIALGCGLSQIQSVVGAGWIHGLKLAAVAVVAHAVWSMARRLTPDTPRAALALASSAGVLLLPGAWVQVGVIAFGGLAGWAFLKRSGADPTAPAHADLTTLSRRTGAACLLGALVLLAVLPLVVRAPGAPRLLQEFDAFYRAGSLVFGGGHVVLPLLREELVPRHWLSDEQFLAGYAAAQAVPGPLFSFAGYLGAAMHEWPRSITHALLALTALFLPGYLFLVGALPFWDRLRRRADAQAALRGANAAVVGVLLGALIDPLITGTIHSALDAVIAAAAFVALLWRAPAWAIVLPLAMIGQIGASSFRGG